MMGIMKLFRKSVVCRVGERYVRQSLLALPSLFLFPSLLPLLCSFSPSLLSSLPLPSLPPSYTASELGTDPSALQEHFLSGPNKRQKKTSPVLQKGGKPPSAESSPLTYTHNLKYTL